MVASGIVISNCRCQAQELTLAEVEEAGYKVFDGSRVPYLPTEDGGTVGRPPGGWDVDRVLANGSRVLSAATPAPNSAAPAPQTP